MLLYHWQVSSSTIVWTTILGCRNSYPNLYILMLCVQISLVQFFTQVSVLLSCWEVIAHCHTNYLSYIAAGCEAQNLSRISWIYFMMSCIGHDLKSGKDLKDSIRTISKGRFTNGVQKAHTASSPWTLRSWRRVAGDACEKSIVGKTQLSHSQGDLTLDHFSKTKLDIWACKHHMHCWKEFDPQWTDLECSLFKPSHDL